MSPQVQVFLATAPVDLRGSFDRLASITREVLTQDPRSGALFIFANRAGNRLKALWWDQNGYALLYKRLSRGKFKLPELTQAELRSVRISREEFSAILAAVGVSKAQNLH
jgi:transposase